MFPTSHGLPSESLLEGDAVTVDRLQPVRQLSVNSARVLYKEVRAARAVEKERWLGSGSLLIMGSGSVWGWVSIALKTSHPWRSATRLMASQSLWFWQMPSSQIALSWGHRTPLQSCAATPVMRSWERTAGSC